MIGSSQIEVAKWSLQQGNRLATETKLLDMRRQDVERRHYRRISAMSISFHRHILFLTVLLLPLAKCDGLILQMMVSQSADLSLRTTTTSSTASLSNKRAAVNKGARRVRSTWNDRFEELKQFKKRYGHTNVPQLPRDGIEGDYKVLATFCRNVRYQYKNRLDPSKAHLCHLTEEKIQKLESIGFVWNNHNAMWRRRFGELQSFNRQFGHCNVPAEIEETYPGLRVWMIIQRRRYRVNKKQKSSHKYLKKLSKEQIRQLESIGFEWEPWESRWWKNFEELKEFRQQHGHFKVPHNYQHQSLRVWLQYVRRCCREYVASVSMEGSCHNVKVSGLDAERLRALRDVHFCWLPDPDAPLENPPHDIFA